MEFINKTSKPDKRIKLYGDTNFKYYNNSGIYNNSVVNNETSESALFKKNKTNYNDSKYKQDTGFLLYNSDIDGHMMKSKGSPKNKVTSPRGEVSP